jgi:hypothetical protein
MQYTETLEVEVESWNEAVKIMNSDADFDRNEDDIVFDSSIEFIGSVDAKEAQTKQAN